MEQHMCMFLSLFQILQHFGEQEAFARWLSLVPLKMYLH